MTGEQFAALINEAGYIPSEDQYQFISRIANLAEAKERQRCVDAVLSVWTPISEDSKRWKDCQNAIHRKIREGSK